MFDTCNVFVPPKPILRSLYKCDKVFHVSYALELYESHDYYVIAFISGKLSEFYLRSPNETRLVKRIKVDLPNQHKTGGSSAPRFGRIRDEKIHTYIKLLVDEMVRLFVPDGQFPHLGLFIGGCGEIKDKIQSEDKFKTFLSKHLIRTITIPEISDQAVNEGFRLIDTLIASVELSDTDLLMRQIEENLRNPALVDLYLFGEEVWSFIVNGELEEVYVTDEYASLIDSQASAKLSVHLMNKAFRTKYGGLVGRRYYSTDLIESDQTDLDQTDPDQAGPSAH